MMVAARAAFKRAETSTERLGGTSPSVVGSNMRSILSLLLVVVFAGAQEPTVKTQVALEPTIKPQVAKETTAKDERVQVLLKNGHSLIGIAKACIRCERLV